MVASADTFHERELEAYGPPSLLINQEYQILHVSETAGRYLMPRKGPITNDLLKVIRPELQYELRSILFQAFEKKKPIISTPIYLDFKGHTHRVILSVRLRPREDQPSETDETESQVALLLFIDEEADEMPGDSQSQLEERSKLLETDGRANTMVEQLENEVWRLRRHLQANIEKYEGSNEELKAANEELQSINEEYRATTEELETSKEELQSINEELQTVNSELKSKVEELLRAHADLENLMAATEFGTLFLDRELCIKRYTPGTERLFNIRPTDRGRPIAHLTNKLSYDNLPRDAAQVLQQLTPVEHKVRGPQGEWFLVRLRPYRTVDDHIDGVVVTFVDVTELKQVEIALRERENELTLAQQAAWAGFWALDLRTKKATVSGVWREIMGLSSPSESETLAELLPIVHEDDRPQVASIGETMEGDLIYELEFRINHPTRGWRWILSRHRPLVAAADGQLRLYGFVMDITARKQMEEALHEREQELRQLNETLESKVNERTQTIQDLAAQLTRAEQEERQRIAQILHDELQQRLYTVQVQLQFLRDSITETSPELIEIEFKEMGKWLTDAIETTRRLSIDLSPPILRDEGLVQAIKW
ncbi:MAG: PAS domain-containing protein, partial [Chloroflexi bacterium]|nr:PAS domain-containing protein [Chloroflexota bacterium]